MGCPEQSLAVKEGVEASASPMTPREGRNKPSQAGKAHSELPLLALQKTGAKPKAEAQEKRQNGFSLLLLLKNAGSRGTGWVMKMIMVWKGP